MQTIIPSLWFNDNAEEAVNFYTSLFKDSKILHVARYDEAGAGASGRPRGSVMTISFEIEGRQFMALNGGPLFTFSPAISFLVNCETQDKIDLLWAGLSEGGETEQCGWLKDRYGVSWQIVPAVLGEMIQSNEAHKTENVMKALLQMKKIDIKKLVEAYEKI